MATEGQKEIGSNLINIRTLTLEPANLRPNGIVVFEDRLMVTDWKACKVYLYRLHDGLLLFSSDKLESCPRGICSVNHTEICVALNNATIEFMSVQETCVIRRGRKIFLHPALDRCDGVATFRDKVFVCGVKGNDVCWCVVSIQDGLLGKVHKVCKGDESFLTTKENMVYISCYAGLLYSPDNNGVYGFNFFNSSQQPYRHKYKLSLPCGITVADNGFLFLCDGMGSIHHLTDKCDLVAIYTEGIPHRPCAIFWYRGILYVTDWTSNVIIMYQTQQGDHLNVQERDEIKQPLIETSTKSLIETSAQTLFETSTKPLTETSTRPGHGIQKMNLVGQISSGASHVTADKDCQLHLRRRALPPGKKYHVFFSYSSLDIQWVKETIEVLEKDHGFVCCEYERDNTPGTPLLRFASDTIRDAYKTVVVMTREAFKSGFVLHEIEMAIMQGFNESRKCVVPVLLEDCEVPTHLRVLNYIDARDPKRRCIWWPKLIHELETQDEAINR